MEEEDDDAEEDDHEEEDDDAEEDDHEEEEEEEEGGGGAKDKKRKRTKKILDFGPGGMGRDLMQHLINITEEEPNGDYVVAHALDQVGGGATWRPRPCGSL